MIEVTGTYRGERHTISWDGGVINAPEPILDAMCAVAASWLARTLYLANGERLKGDLFDHPSGFVAVAFATMEDASTDWEAPSLPEGELP